MPVHGKQAVSTVFAPRAEIAVRLAGCAKRLWSSRTLERTQSLRRAGPCRGPSGPVLRVTQRGDLSALTLSLAALTLGVGLLWRPPFPSSLPTPSCSRVVGLALWVGWAIALKQHKVLA